MIKPIHNHSYYLAGNVEREINNFHYYAYKFKCDECGGVIVNSGWLPEPHRNPEQYANTYNQYYKTLMEEIND